MLAQNAFGRSSAGWIPKFTAARRCWVSMAIVMKAHGSARERAITNAIRVTTENLQHQINQTSEISRRKSSLRAQRTVLEQGSRNRATHFNPNSPLTRNDRLPCMSPLLTEIQKPPRQIQFPGPHLLHRRRRLLCARRILTNAELEKMVDTTDEWITTRTGIKERHIAAEDEFTSDLARKAALRAMESGWGHAPSRSI